MDAVGGHDGPVVLVGGSAGLLDTIGAFQPERSVILLGEPDVVRKRRLREATASSPHLRELIECGYQRDDAADTFYHQHRDLRPAAVIPVFEYGVPFAARLAERYGVPGAGYGAARLLRDKRLQRAVTTAAGIPNPQSVAVDDVGQVQAFMSEVGGPVVIKPANRQSAVGTKIVQEPAEVPAAWADCLDQDEGVMVPDEPMPLRMLAERFVSGEEFSVEMLVDCGRPVFGAATRKFLFPGHRPVEQGHLHPADTDPQLTDQLLTSTVRVVDAVGMATGFVHCEWIVERGVPYLVECAGRTPGDWIINLVTLAWRYDVRADFYTLMKGQRPAGPPPAASHHVAIWMTAAPFAGEVESVDGVADAAAAAGVEKVISVGPGDQVHELRSSWDRTSGVIAAGATPHEALGNARRAVELIKIKIRPRG